MPRKSKIIVVGLLLCLLLPLSVFLVWAWMFPFGRKSALLPCMRAGLSAYAWDHEGWFPDSKDSPFEALVKLYPTYCTPTELAGISGDAGEVKSTLEQQKALSEGITGWVYRPGFRRDDPHNVAILWERTPGFYSSGRRNFFGGRPVLFADGSISNIPASAWERFLKQQEELRQSLRNARTNVPTTVNAGGP